MQFKTHSHVYDPENRDLGRIDRVVMDPVTNKVTHVVVRQGLIFTEDKVIPIEYFRSATPEQAVLREDVGNLDALPVFEETQYVPAEYVDTEVKEPDNGLPGLYWYPPMGMTAEHITGYYGAPAYPATPKRRRYVKSTMRNIPDNTVALKEGADVFSADDKHVGSVEQIHVDLQSDYATHILISQGLFLKEKKWVPTLWIRRVEEDKVYLSVKSPSLETLPEVETA